MKTAMQELMERFNEELSDDFYDWLEDNELRLLEKEKEDHYKTFEAGSEFVRNSTNENKPTFLEYYKQGYNS